MYRKEIHQLMAWSHALATRYRAEVDERLYHLTDAESIASILANGLRPGMPSQFDAHLLRPGHSYFCDRRVAGWALSGAFDASWGDCVISVAIGDLDLARFDGDEDYWRGAPGVSGSGWRDVLAAFPWIDEPDRIDAALRDGGTVSYVGIVAPELVRVEFIDPYRVDVPALADIAGPRHWRD